MTFQICLAGQVIEIHSLYNKVFEMCKKYIIPTTKKPSIIIKIEQKDIEREDKANLYAEWKRKAPAYMSYSPKYLETIAVYRKIATAMLYHDTFVMHGSVISTGGNGIMIAAPSGVGKTTRTKLWIQNIPNSNVINGDKPLICLSTSDVLAYGTPWSGKESWDTNASVPLRAILFLERAEEGEDNTISEITLSEALPMLLRQTFQPETTGNKIKTLQLLKALEGNITFYKFRSAPTLEAVKLAYETVRAK